MDRSWKRATQPSVVDQLQEYLVQSGAKPGDRLPTEPEFAAELGVGRSSVREGIQALQAMGIVDVRHGRGTYLSEGSLGGLSSALVFWSRLALNAEEAGGDQSTLALVTEVRVVLESALVHRVVGRHDEESLAALESLVDLMAELAERDEFAPGPDREFHHVLYAPLRNWVLDSIIASFWEAMQRTIGSGVVGGDIAAVVTVHRDIVAALRAGDHAALDVAMASHFRTMESWYPS